MRTIAMALVVIGCGNQDVITNVPEAGLDAPVAEAGPDVAPDGLCTPPKTCTIAADCDDCNPCTVDTCGAAGCESTQMAPPCCGDALCTPGENCKTCALDCGECECCVEHEGMTGCANATIETCVCTNGASQAADCCDNAAVGWDQTCVEDVTTLGCGTCDCCTVHPDGGCEDQNLSDCVCAMDPLCCTGNGWDATCVGEVASLGCGSC